jgi:hypothetical protein
MLTSRVVMRRELQENSLRLYYFEAGVGAPLVMLHGLGLVGQSAPDRA